MIESSSAPARTGQRISSSPSAGSSSASTSVEHAARYMERSFDQVLRNERTAAPQSALPAVPAVQESNLRTKLVGYLTQFSRDWGSSEAKGAQLVAQAPQGVRPLFEMQLLVNKLSLQMNIAARCADSAASTLRQVQQMGSR